MSKLIYANLARMIKSRVFWIAEFFMAGYSIFAYAMARINMQRSSAADEWRTESWTLYFFNEMTFIGVITAVFAVAFIGAEYGGPIRNKIIAGHTRKDIYLSDFIVCYAASVIQFLTYCITSVIFSVLLVGKMALTGMERLSWRIVGSLLILAVYAAVFTMLAVLDSNRVRSMAAGFLLALAFYILMTQIYGDLQEPELTSRVVLSESGEMQIEENIPNRKYVSGAKRTLYEWIDAFLPMDQTMYVMDPDTVFSAKAPLCMLGETLIFTGIGIYFFKRKDIK